MANEYLQRAKEFIRGDSYCYFAKYCEKYEINNALRLAHFLSQINHESGDMKRLEENLNYRKKDYWKYSQNIFITMKLH